MDAKMWWAVVIALAIVGIGAPRAAAANSSITVIKAGAGSGTVVSDPAGINCGNVCMGSFASNQGIGLEATPDAGSRLASWSGPCSNSTTNVCLLLSPIPATIVATFVKTQTLTVAKAGNGTGTVTSTPAGIYCGATCSAAFDQGSTVTLTASTRPGDGTFAGWSGGDCSGTDPCTVTMDAAKTVTATFVSPYLLEVSFDPTGSGSGRVTSSPAGIDCTAFCSAGFLPGTVVTLTITPDSESSFSLGNVCSGSGSTPITCTFTMNAAKRLDLRFTSYRRLTVATTGSGSGRLKATLGPIDCGAVCTETMNTGLSVDFHEGQYCLGYECIIPTADAGSRFAGFSGAGCSAQPVSGCSVNMNADTTITATFTKTQTLTVTKDGTGTGSVRGDAGIDCGNTCSATVDQDAKVTLTATPAANARFAGWSGGGCSGTGSCTVTLDAAAHVKATFNAGGTVTVHYLGDGSGTVTSVPAGIDCPRVCSAVFDLGSKVVLRSIPDAGSGLSFNGVDGGCEEGLATTTCTFTVTRNMSDDAAWYVARTLSVVRTGAGSGRVTSSNTNIDCGTTCSAVTATGGIATLRAQADPGSTFAGWSGGGCSGTHTECDASIDGDTQVTARFEAAAAPTPTPTATPEPTATPQPEPVPSPAASTPPLPPPAGARAPALVIDTKLVKAKITRGKRTATFTFANVNGAKRFQCALTKKGKKARFASCASPKTYKKLARGTYTFQVRTVGDATPATKRFKI
jgi:hypothetical protein